MTVSATEMTYHCTAVNYIIIKLANSGTKKMTQKDASSMRTVMVLYISLMDLVAIQQSRDYIHVPLERIAMRTPQAPTLLARWA